MDRPAELEGQEFADFEQPLVRAAYKHSEHILSAEQGIGNITHFVRRKLVPVVDFCDRAFLSVRRNHKKLSVPEHAPQLHCYRKLPGIAVGINNRFPVQEHGCVGQADPVHLPDQGFERLFSGLSVIGGPDQKILNPVSSGAVTCADHPFPDSVELNGLVLHQGKQPVVDGDRIAGFQRFVHRALQPGEIPDKAVRIGIQHNAVIEQNPDQPADLREFFLAHDPVPHGIQHPGKDFEEKPPQVQRTLADDLVLIPVKAVIEKAVDKGIAGAEHFPGREFVHIVHQGLPAEQARRNLPGDGLPAVHLVQKHFQRLLPQGQPAGADGGEGRRQIRGKGSVVKRENIQILPGNQLFFMQHVIQPGSRSVVHAENRLGIRIAGQQPGGRLPGMDGHIPRLILVFCIDQPVVLQALPEDPLPLPGVGVVVSSAEHAQLRDALDFDQIIDGLPDSGLVVIIDGDFVLQIRGQVYLGNSPVNIPLHPGLVGKGQQQSVEMKLLVHHIDQVVPDLILVHQIPRVFAVVLPPGNHYQADILHVFHHQGNAVDDVRGKVRKRVFQHEADGSDLTAAFLHCPSPASGFLSFRVCSAHRSGIFGTGLENRYPWE